MPGLATASRVTRAKMAAGEKTAIRPKMPTRSFSIGVPVAAGNLEYHTSDVDDDEYVVIVAGFEREFHTTNLLDPSNIGFWLKSTNGGLTIADPAAVIIWH